MRWRVERFENISSVPAGEWQATVERAGASIFYSWNAISAYAADPLLPASKAFYFVVRDEAGAVRAVLPAYVQEDFDPFGLIGPHIRDFDSTGRRGLLTHYWHCYDTIIAGDAVDRSLAQSIVESLKETARDCGAACYGFLNVPRQSPTHAALDSLQLPALPIWERFRLHVSDLRTFDTYLCALPPKAHKDVQRQLRLMAEADAVCRVERLPFARLDEAIALCHATAARRGTGFYYQPRQLKAFLLGCEAAVRIICVELRGDLLCAFICFADAKRLHVWAGGVRYDLSRFSPYVAAFVEAIRYAIENGYAIVEGGRGNGKKKEALGFEGFPLSAFIAISK